MLVYGEMAVGFVRYAKGKTLKKETIDIKISIEKPDRRLSGK